MKLFLATCVVCLLVLSEWVSGFHIKKRDTNAVTTVKEPPEEALSPGTFQSDMKFGVFQADLKERIKAAKTGQKKRKAFADLNSRWPNAKIPYTIDATSASDAVAIENAMALWQSQTCLEFVPFDASQHTDHINFFKEKGCWSFVGKQGTGAQDISIGDGCAGIGTIAHEIGHALGFHHEQSRSDRDDFVTILYENIRTGLEDNFVKYAAETETISHGVPYDPTSVMHYAGFYFSANGKPTITTKKPLDQFYIGQRDHLSFSDVRLANLMYNCPSFCNSGLNCQNGGYETKAGGVCQCSCPRGYTGSLCEVDDTAAHGATNCLYELTEPSGTIQSPNYPNNYDNSKTCAWHIKGGDITLTFEDLDVEPESSCAYDSVGVRVTSMFEDDTKICGSSVPAAQTSTTGEMMVVFKSDTSATHKGFKASYAINQQATQASPTQSCASCGSTLSGSGCLASPNFPNNYGNNENCVWKIEVSPGSRVALQVTTLDIGIPGSKCTDDALLVSLAGDDVTQVRPLSLCGSNLPAGPIISLGSSMSVQFKSDSDTVRGGFEATFLAKTI